ncbi:MAG: hypothetical protein FJX34_03140 [Alphaproteobacteria bacterium]|nr:hypothetical protein [Alphaproteobacteria bacterium]
MKKLFTFLVALTLTTSCSGIKKEETKSANKYSSVKEESAKSSEVKTEKKVKKQKEKKEKKHGGSEVK